MDLLKNLFSQKNQKFENFKENIITLDKTFKIDFYCKFDGKIINFKIYLLQNNIPIIQLFSYNSSRKICFDHVNFFEKGDLFIGFSLILNYDEVGYDEIQFKFKKDKIYLNFDNGFEFYISREESAPSIMYFMMLIFYNGRYNLGSFDPPLDIPKLLDDIEIRWYTLKFLYYMKNKKIENENSILSLLPNDILQLIIFEIKS